MSYSIHYGPGRPKHLKKKKGYHMIGAVTVLLVCAMAVGWSLPEQAERFCNVLFPWSRQEVQIAFAEFKSELRQGEPIADAVTSFCLEILHGTEEPQ